MGYNILLYSNPWLNHLSSILLQNVLKKKVGAFLGGHVEFILPNLKILMNLDAFSVTENWFKHTFYFSDELSIHDSKAH